MSRTTPLDHYKQPPWKQPEVKLDTANLGVPPPKLPSRPGKSETYANNLERMLHAGERYAWKEAGYDVNMDWNVLKDREGKPIRFGNVFTQAVSPFVKPQPDENVSHTILVREVINLEDTEMKEEGTEIPMEIN